MIDSKLKGQLEKEKNEQLRKLSIQNEEAEFLESFLVNNSFKGIYSIEDLVLYDLFIAYLTSLTSRLDIEFSTIKDAVYQNASLFGIISVENFIYTMDLITADYDGIEISETENENSKGKKYVELELEIRDDVVGTEKHDKFNELISIAKENDANLASLIRIYNMVPEEFMEAGILIASIIEFKTEIKQCENSFDRVKASLPIRVSQKKSKQIIEEKLMNDFDLEEYNEIIKYIREYCTRVISDEKIKQKELRKCYNIYQDVIKEIEKFEEKENSMYQLHPSFLKIPNESLRIELLKQIYEHNLKLGKTTITEYEELSKNTKQHYKKVLKKYGISIPEELINFEMNVDDLEESLELLKQSGIKEHDNILKILRFSDIEIIRTLSSNVSKGLIKSALLLENINLFDKNNKERFNQLQENIEYLKSEKVSATTINKMNEVILSDADLLKQNITALKEYSLFKNIKKCESYSFLISDDIVDKMDKLLELGLEQNLQEDMTLLNYPYELYNRLLILKELSIPLDSTEEIKKVLESNSFLIPNNKLDDYILDKSLYINLKENIISKEEFINKLESSKDEESTKRVYKFNNLLVSKNKVVRALSNIESEMITINQQVEYLTKNQPISQENIDTIRQILSSDEKNAVMIKK